VIEIPPQLPIRLPSIRTFVGRLGGDDETDDETVTREDEDGGPDSEFVYGDLHSIEDGELYVYSDNDLTELSLEAFNQLVHRGDLTEQQAKEISDLFYTLHRLDIRDLEVITDG